MTFTLNRIPLEPRRRELVVTRVVDVAPGYRRVELAGDLDGWSSPGPDDHVRIFLPVDGADVATWPSREFTPIPIDGGVAFEFVLHDAGPASDWARGATTGDRLVMGGPRGSMAIEGEPDWWLLLGDLTAAPAIGRFRERIPTSAPVTVRLDETAALIAALPTLTPPPGDGFVFIAAEQSVVAAGRAFLTAQGIDPARAVVKGYWRRGLSADAPK